MHFIIKVLPKVLPRLGIMGWVLFAVAPATAAEVFVCEDGTSVAVELGQLATMKKTNACVAAHFGLRVDKRAPTTKRHASVQIPPLPERKVSPSPVDALKARNDPARRKRERTGLALAANKPPVAQPRQSNYRNVHIINAAPGADRWYRHAR